MTTSKLALTLCQSHTTTSDACGSLFEEDSKPEWWCVWVAENFTEVFFSEHVLVPDDKLKDTKLVGSLLDNKPHIYQFDLIFSAFIAVSL